MISMTILENKLIKSFKKNEQIPKFYNKKLKF